MFRTIYSILITLAIVYISLNPPSHIRDMAVASVSRSVVKKVLSIETPEGAGALVRRSIGTSGLKNLTPFLMLDHFHVAQGAVSRLLVFRYADTHP